MRQDVLVLITGSVVFVIGIVANLLVLFRGKKNGSQQTLFDSEMLREQFRIQQEQNSELQKAWTLLTELKKRNAAMEAENSFSKAQMGLLEEKYKQLSMDLSVQNQKLEAQRVLIDFYKSEALGKVKAKDLLETISQIISDPEKGIIDSLNLLIKNGRSLADVSQIKSEYEDITLKENQGVIGYEEVRKVMAQLRLRILKLAKGGVRSAI